MKRKILWMILLTTALLIAGCGKKDTNTPSRPDNTKQNGSANTDSNTDSNKTSNSNIEVGETLDPDDFADMTKAIDSLILNVCENNRTYNSTDAEFFWSSIYYGVVNYTDEVRLAEWVDGEIRVRRMGVQEFAAGLFADYSDLLKLPASLSTIRYDEGWDAYIFTPSDRGMYYTRLISASRQKSGDIRLSAVLCDAETDKPFACFVFTLVPNAYADATTDPIFRYSISDMKASDAVNCEGDLPTLIGSYQDFLDQNTVEFKIDGNLITFQVYDQDIITLLSEMKVGEEVALAVSINNNTENRTIKSLIMK